MVKHCALQYFKDVVIGIRAKVSKPLYESTYVCMHVHVSVCVFPSLVFQKGKSLFGGVKFWRS